MASDYELEVARNIGGLQADMRTVKHDVANISGKIDALSNQMSSVTNKQERGLGFFAGAAFIMTLCGGVLLAAARMVFGVGP